MSESLRSKSPRRIRFRFESSRAGYPDDFRAVRVGGTLTYLIAAKTTGRITTSTTLLSFESLTGKMTLGGTDLENCDLDRLSRGQFTEWHSGKFIWGKTTLTECRRWRYPASIP